MERPQRLRRSCHSSQALCVRLGRSFPHRKNWALRAEKEGWMGGRVKTTCQPHPALRVPNLHIPQLSHTFTVSPPNRMQQITYNPTLPSPSPSLRQPKGTSRSRSKSTTLEWISWIHSPNTSLINSGDRKRKRAMKLPLGKEDKEKQYKTTTCSHCFP